MNSFETMKQNVEQGKMGKGSEKILQTNLDIARAFNNVFSTPEGQLVLEQLRKCSQTFFPNYSNVNATYSKIGEQELVKHIEGMIKLSKKE